MAAELFPVECFHQMDPEAEDFLRRDDGKVRTRCGKIVFMHEAMYGPLRVTCPDCKRNPIEFPV